MFSVFRKGAAHQNLTPGERAFLKLIEGFVIAGIVAALPVLSLALGQQTPNWSAIIRIALGTFATAALMAAVKYCKAQGDPPLAQALTTAAGVVEQFLGASDVGNKPASAPLPPAGQVPGGLVLSGTGGVLAPPSASTVHLQVSTLGAGASDEPPAAEPPAAAPVS